MKYIKSGLHHAEQIYNLVQNTIKTIYPKYYPQEVVDFFCNHHNMDNIIADIQNECTYILLENDFIFGTGSCVDNHISRLFVSPEYQGKGYGSYIMEQLEREINKRYDSVEIDASLSACKLYENHGYITITHNNIEVENGKILVYEIMRKNLK